MNSKSLEVIEKFVPRNYVTQANQCMVSHENEIRILLEKVWQKLTSDNKKKKDIKFINIHFFI